jgi:hypothetical protein
MNYQTKSLNIKYIQKSTIKFIKLLMIRSARNSHFEIFGEFLNLLDAYRQACKFFWWASWGSNPGPSP